jgi:hypothetical protein
LLQKFHQLTPCFAVVFFQSVIKHGLNCHFEVKRSSTNHFHIRKMISKMRYKTFNRSTFWWLPIHLLGLTNKNYFDLLLRNNLLKGMAVALGWLLIKLWFAFHLSQYQCVLSVIYSTLGIFIFFKDNSFTFPILNDARNLMFFALSQMTFISLKNIQNFLLF